MIVDFMTPSFGHDEAWKRDAMVGQFEYGTWDWYYCKYPSRIRSERSCATHHFRTFWKCSLHMLQVLVVATCPITTMNFTVVRADAPVQIYFDSWMLKMHCPGSSVHATNTLEGSQHESTVFPVGIVILETRGYERDGCYQIWQAGGTGCAIRQSHIGSHDATDVVLRTYHLVSVFGRCVIRRVQVFRCLCSWLRVQTWHSYAVWQSMSGGRGTWGIGHAAGFAGVVYSLHNLRMSYWLSQDVCRVLILYNQREQDIYIYIL